MRVLLLALTLMADGGTPPEGGVELTVYRSASSLPRDWAKLLPPGFDFRTEMVATRARAGDRVELAAAARLERHGANLHLWAHPRVEPMRECPPCRGVQDSSFLPARSEELLPPVPLFRLARARGKVFLLPAPLAAAVPLSRCPICTVP